jgi:hypothetical protein
MKSTSRIAVLSFAIFGSLARAEPGQRPLLDASRSEWIELPNSKFIDHVQCKGLPNCNPQGVFDAWSSAVLDTTRDCLVILGIPSPATPTAASCTSRKERELRITC